MGLDYSSDQSYVYFMRHNFFDHINIDLANTNIPKGTNPDARAECTCYDNIIRSLGGIDLQLLGLGPNGHIGFNEPDDSFTKGTHKVALTDATIQANKRFFEKEEDAPRYAYTMGICDIMQAERVVMVVSGESKAGIVKEAFTGPVTPSFFLPSFLPSFLLLLPPPPPSSSSTRTSPWWPTRPPCPSYEPFSSALFPRPGRCRAGALSDRIAQNQGRRNPAALVFVILSSRRTYPRSGAEAKQLQRSSPPTGSAPFLGSLFSPVFVAFCRHFRRFSPLYPRFPGRPPPHPR